jgi:aminoglycoside phosphotransferase (APT) family kinase protein
MSIQPPPASGIDFDPNRLQAFLAGGSADVGGSMRVERVGGGQSNPTYFINFDRVEMVLRKRPPGDLPPAAHDVGREYRILRALAETALPVPKPMLYCEDPTIIGTPFYTMERLHGRIFHDAALPEVSPKQRREIYRGHAGALAGLHAIDWRGLGLGHLARPGSFLGRQIDRWTRAWGNDRAADVARVSGWLHQHQPDPETVTLIHGDFKFTNVVFHPTLPELIGILDWELAGVGDPMLDLAHNWSAMWATTPQEYGGILGLNLDEKGLPPAEEYFADYYAAAGTPDRLQPFHKVLALFRNAGIFRGIGERAAAGIATAANADVQGALGPVYLERALDTIANEGD